MKKNIIIIILFILPLAHTVVSQNNQTIVVRPETYREKQEREMRDAVEFINDLGSIFGSTPEQRKTYLTEVKNSKYSTFVEKRLTEWKKKGEFEKTADWQKRLTDSTAIKKVQIQESDIDKFARELRVVEKQDYYSTTYELNKWLYDSKGEYDADKEVLNINTFWGKIPIPIPIDKAKNMREDIKNVGYLTARFFIYNDQLTLLSLSLYRYDNYIYENQSVAAKNFRQKATDRRKIEVEKEFKKIQIDIGNEIIDIEKGVEEKGEIYSGVEIQPYFPGGDAELMKFIRDNLRYPTIAAENGVEGRVTVRFVVAKNGEITNVEVLRGLDPSCDKEAIRVVKSMPKWIPGKQNGAAVNVYYTLPITFRLG